MTAQAITAPGLPVNAMTNIEVQSLEHLGLVAAAIESLKLVELIDERLPLPKNSEIKVTHGQRVKAMIINGLGYTSSPLYITPDFYLDKDIERLIGPGVEAAHLNDKALGRTLDALFDYGTSKLFAEIAFEVAQARNLFGASLHLDTTTLLLHGEFTQAIEQADKVKALTAGKSVTIKDRAFPARGHSKAHRHDLKQVTMALIVTGKASCPLWFEGLPGNRNDKASFHETISKFIAQIESADEFLWVADAALYSKGKLQHSPIQWLTRVPQTTTNAQMLVRLPDNQIQWKDLGNGYQGATYDALEDGELWSLIFSEQAYKRESVTFKRRIEKALEKAEKALRKLCKDPFDCEQDALNTGQKWAKTLGYHCAEFTVEQIKCYNKRGKPPEGAIPDRIEYKLKGCLSDNKEEQALKRNQLGRFILATNDIDNAELTAQIMLSTYKEQQNVERGFRFIKSDEFHLDSIYLQLPSRIDALMMVMTLSLMVYNTSEHQMRETMAEQGAVLPNQKGKPTERPTLRWVFQMMRGVHTLRLAGSVDCVAGKNGVKETIIRLFGERACAIYGVDP